MSGDPARRINWNTRWLCRAWAGFFRPILAAWTVDRERAGMAALYRQDVVRKACLGSPRPFTPVGLGSLGHPAAALEEASPALSEIVTKR